MTEPRVHVDLDLQVGDLLTLPESAYRHLVVVLRRIRGDRVTLFNGRGGEYGVTLERIERRRVLGRVEEFRDVSRESPLCATLAQAVSKGERMDYAVQKAVELGVSAIQPLVSDRVVVRLDDERWQRKREHWQSVAIAACEQSGRTRVPTVAPVLELRDWLARCSAGSLRLVLAPAGAPATVPRHDGQEVLLLVGPEGGFSEIEMRLVDLSGFHALRLGPRVLRTETAALVALSVVQSTWGDLGSALSRGP